MLTKMFRHGTTRAAKNRCCSREQQQQPSTTSPSASTANTTASSSGATHDDAGHHKTVRRALLDLERHSANDDRVARLAAAITSHRNPPRTSPEAIARLPRTRILPGAPGQPSDDDASCGICCDSLANSGRIMLTTLPCGHVYHTTCIVRWLNRSNVCPECRYELETTEDASYEAGRLERMKDRKRSSRTEEREGGVQLSFLPKKQEKECCCGDRDDETNNDTSSCSCHSASPSEEFSL